MLKVAVNEYITQFVGLCELSKKYKINPKLIRSELEALGYNLGKGVDPKTVVNMKKAIDEYTEIIRNGEEPNINTIRIKYGVSHQSLKSNIEKKGLNIVRYPKVNNLDEFVFDVIDTEEKAYWLGFLSADGWIESRYNTIGLALKLSDLEHLKKFADFLKFPKEKIHIRNNKACSLTVGNAHLKNQLINLGFDTEKSHSLKFPDLSIFKNKDLIRHWLRGLFDGDGSVGIYSKKKKGFKTSYNSKFNNLYPHISLTGTKEVLKGILNHLNLNVKIQDYEIYGQFSLDCRKAYDFLNFIYKDCVIFLDRKYEIYKNVCRLYEESYKLLLVNIGGNCDVNTEITPEIKESGTSYSVEVEPDLSE
jgi:hypothetical protein